VRGQASMLEPRLRPMLANRSVSKYKAQPGVGEVAGPRGREGSRRGSPGGGPIHNLRKGGKDITIKSPGFKTDRAKKRFRQGFLKVGSWSRSLRCDRLEEGHCPK